MEIPKFFTVDLSGVYYDITNSKVLSSKEKKYLIASVDDFVYRDVPLQTRARHLLWRVRKKYHIILKGLSMEAEPQSFIDKILF